MLEAHPGSYLAQILRHSVFEGSESALVRSLVRQGDFCIDAGAHVGYYSSIMLEAGAKVLAIEPNPKHVPLLERNAAGAIIYPVALSDSNADEVPFYLPSDYDDGWGSLGSSDLGRKTQITVSTRRLDSILDELKWDGPIRLLKLDIEGAELLALRGMGKYLERVSYILMECIDVAARIEILGSTVEGINALLEGWTVRQPAVKVDIVPKAVSGGNFLFVNPSMREIANAA